MYFKGQPPKHFGGLCLADNCKFANAECRGRDYISEGTCYCVSDFQFNGKDCLPTEENEAWQKGYGAACSDSSECKFTGAECNQNELCVCPGEQYFDAERSACISREEYRVRSLKKSISVAMEQTQSPGLTESTIDGMKPEKIPCIENATSTTVATTPAKVRMTTETSSSTRSSVITDDKEVREIKHFLN